MLALLLLHLVWPSPSASASSIETPLRVGAAVVDNKPVVGRLELCAGVAEFVAAELTAATLAVASKTPVVPATAVS